MNKRLFLIALVGGITAFAADDSLPKAETILDRYIEVTGGKAAYEKRKTEIATGTFEFAAQGLKGTLVRYAAAPDKSYSTIDLDGVGKIEMGTADGVAWEKNVMIGPRVKSGEEKAQALRESFFNAQFLWRKLFSKAETLGVETIDGEECYKVLLTPAEGKPETTYYQKKSGLAVKTTMIAVSQMGEVPLEVVIGGYKSFDGVSSPAKVTQRVAGQEFTITIESVKVNEDIPADRFDPPADIKALLNKAATPPAKK